MSNPELVTEITNAIGAHGSWKIKLRTAITKGSSEHTPEVVRCDDKCAFGQWLHGSSIDETTRGGAPYKVIKRLHAEFHVCAANVLSMAVTGNTSGAANLLNGDFTAQSEKLVRGLRKWKKEES